MSDQSQAAHITPQKIWDVYANAVGGVTFDGKPLPEYDALGKQQSGWQAVADHVNACNARAALGEIADKLHDITCHIRRSHRYHNLRL